MDLPPKPILCFDFDGVIHSYISSWRGAHVIPDPPVVDRITGENAIEALLRYVESFTVCIHTSRFNSWQEDGPAQIAVWDWLRLHGMPGDMVNVDADRNGIMEGKVNLCATKPGAFLTEDDRARTFDGTFQANDQIKAFRPWNKKDKKEASHAVR
jgi:hypothetical protein